MAAMALLQFKQLALGKLFDIDGVEPLFEQSIHWCLWPGDPA